MKRSGLVRRTPLRRVSRKRAREQRQYTRLRVAYIEGHARCEWPAGCIAAATDVHHRKGRTGSLYLDVDHWSALCRAHHSWLTEHPAEAVRLGMSELRVGVSVEQALAWGRSVRWIMDAYGLNYGTVQQVKAGLLAVENEAVA